MATKTLLNIEQYIALGEDPPGMRYELSDGELIVTPSSSSFHNEICDRLIARLLDFLDKHPLGRVISETDVQLSESTVRRPDVAFVSDERLQGVDRHHTPLAAVPNL
ncbi:MAG: Uma2 family endonuclease, partial [Terriglobales bacterium]